jgi:hypothetical protein
MQKNLLLIQTPYFLPLPSPEHLCRNCPQDSHQKHDSSSIDQGIDMNYEVIPIGHRNRYRPIQGQKDGVEEEPYSCTTLHSLLQGMNL